MGDQGKIIIYQAEDGPTHVEVKIEDGTVWLSQQQMADLYQTSGTNAVEHIGHIHEEGELGEQLTCRSFRQVRQEGGREVTRNTPFYNFDMIISLRYRVKSSIAMRPRRWATVCLRECTIKGFTMDDGRLRGDNGGNYWRELFGRIRDIRSFKKVLYRQMLGLYATSVNYDPHDEDPIEFSKIIQSKLHFAAHGHTAAGVICEYADSEKLFMGLITFLGKLLALKDISIAKSYLNEEGLEILNNLVSGHFDLVEVNAMEHKPIHMKDYIGQLDAILLSGNRKLLMGYGKVSHDQTMKKAKAEYRKYQENVPSPVEQSYMETIRGVGENAKKRARKESENRK